MFRRLGLLSARFPIYIIVAWIVALVAVMATAPKLGDVISASQASYLPSSFNSQQAQTILEKAFPHASPSSALVIVTGPTATRAEAIAAYSRYAAHHLHPAVSQIASDSLTPALRTVLDSRDGAASMVSIGWSQPQSSSAPAQAVAQLRSYIKAHPYAGITARVTGDVAINADYQGQVNSSTSITTIATVILVLAIMLLLFRSLVLPVVPLLTIGISIMISMGVVAFFGTHGMIVSQNTPIFMIVLLAGAGTDYCLFLANRYREELQNGAEPREAIVTTVTHVGASIASSAVAVIVGMGGMAFAQFGLFNTTGPAVAVSVAVALAAGLTLAPALLALFGRYTFWPATTLTPRPSRFWGPISRAVTGHPVIALVLLLTMLVPLNLAVLRANQSFSFISDLGASVESRAGFTAMQAHYGAGNSLPETLVIQSAHSLRNSSDLGRLDALNDVLSRLPDAASVTGPTRPTGHPIPYHAYATIPAVSHALAQNLSANGRVAQFTIVSTADVYGAKAHALMNASLSKASTSFPGALVRSSGATAQAADLQQVTHDDLMRIALFVLGGILVVLMLLLRSVVAPIYLILTVLLSFGATLGAATAVFQGLGGQGGLTYWVPILMLTFLIGLGIDYNILLMSRVREEAAKGGSYRAAVAHAVERTGSIITTCGLIMAGTFGTLMLASVMGLRELGFAVAIGVILDTFLMRSILVPAIVVLFGQLSWFPGRLNAVAVRRYGGAAVQEYGAEAV